MMANNMIVCRPISKEEELSTLLQHKAIKALVLGDDETIASESDDVSCWSYSSCVSLFFNPKMIIYHNIYSNILHLLKFVTCLVLSNQTLC